MPKARVEDVRRVERLLEKVLENQQQISCRLCRIEGDLMKLLETHKVTGIKVDAGTPIVRSNE